MRNVRISFRDIYFRNSKEMGLNVKDFNTFRYPTLLLIDNLSLISFI